MIAGLVAAGVFVVGMVALSWYLRRHERHGDWDKEGHGTGRREPGVYYREMEVPPTEPFD
jgi:hypothetical protein